MPKNSHHKRNAVNNQPLAETCIRSSIESDARSQCNAAQIMAENKRLGEERKAASEALVGKKVIAGGLVGKAVRIDEITGSIVVKSPW